MPPAPLPPAPPVIRRLAAGVVAGLCVVVLLLAAPRPSDALGLVAAPSSLADPFAPVVAVLALLAWGLALWLALAVLVTLGACLPGRLGRAHRGLARRLLPVAVRRAVELALGVSLAITGLGASSAAAATAPPAAAQVSSAQVSRAQPAPEATAAPAGPTQAPLHPTPVVPSLDWPTTTMLPAVPDVTDRPPATPTRSQTAENARRTSRSPVAGDEAGRPTPAAGSSTAPADPPPPSPPAEALPTARATSAVPPPAARAPVTEPRPSADGATTGHVVVATGDSLWDLARVHLRTTGQESSDAAVAQAWPSWWSANREVVGDDPDLLLPGMHLTPPQLPS